jgi:hypothetical protein
MVSELDVFEGFPSIARLSREIVVTEKIDGTNAQICIDDAGAVRAGSRNRWIDLDGGEHFGFGSWVKAHRDELIAGLGVGRHFGEWWGKGVNRRGYGIEPKRFSLFNVSRWQGSTGRATEGAAPPPACCDAVPVLYQGPFDTAAIDIVLAALAAGGSVAAPGFAQPEGIVVFHAKSGVYFKKTIGDDGHKGPPR